MNNPASELSTVQQRKLCSICWQYEQVLDSGQSVSTAEFLASIDDTDGLDPDFLLAEFEAIRAERSQRIEKEGRLYRPPEDQRYQLIEEIARGGSAVVWRMRDHHLQRDIAVKFLLDSQNNRLMRARLEREARLCARLVHPGIVPIHELSQFSDGRPFVSMKLVEGNTLQQLLDAQPPMPLHSTLEIFAKVCQAMAYAHQQRVIHRDLKPANIMVGKFGEVQIMDWGLAKELENLAASSTTTLGQAARLENPVCSPSESIQTDGQISHDSTVHGVVFGTIAYMSPEQALGQVSAIDTRSDVFSLGAILCRILIGHPPYYGCDQLSMLEKAQRVDLAEATSKLRVNTNRLVAELAIRCLSANPDGRPRDAGMLADLVQATFDSVRKKRQFKMTVASASIVIVLLVGVVTWASINRENVEGLVGRNAGIASTNNQATLDELAVPSAISFVELIKSKQHDHALKYYKQVLSANPNDANLHHVTAAFILNLQMFEAAEAVAKRYTELESDQAEGYFVLSQAQYFQGKLDEAKQSLVECRRLKQKAGLEIKTIDDKLAEIERDYLVIKQLDEHPIEYFEKLHAEEISEVAKVCTIKQRIPEAIRMYSRLISLAPNPLQASIVRYNAMFKFAKPSLLADGLKSDLRNLVAQAATDWLGDQLSFIVDTRNLTSPDKDLVAAADQLTEILKKRPEVQAIRNLAGDNRIDQQIRDQIAGLFKQIDAL